MKGIKFNQTTLHFSSATLASGSLYDFRFKEGIAVENVYESKNWERMHYYLVVATLEDCPSPPGYKQNDESPYFDGSCLAYITFECPQFVEDIEPYFNFFEDVPTQCDLTSESMFSCEDSNCAISNNFS